MLVPAGLYLCFKDATDAKYFLALYGATAVYFAGVMVCTGCPVNTGRRLYYAENNILISFLTSFIGHWLHTFFILLNGTYEKWFCKNIRNTQGITSLSAIEV